jgi:predicted tellurium resistance membrane protein TerC
MLMLDGVHVHVHVPKGYIYFAIFFSLFSRTTQYENAKKQTSALETTIRWQK